MNISNIGGVFFLLSFWHFVSDWWFQSHHEAMNKSKNALIRLRHCVVYTALMSLLQIANVFGDNLITAVSIMFSSHFLIDTYVPVYAWARYLRRDPVFLEEGTELEKFIKFFSKPIGLVLGITMDQSLHIVFLLPIAIISVHPEYLYVVNLITTVITVLLAFCVFVFGNKLKNS